MPFEPYHERHAIAEVTFALTSDAALTHEERSKAKDGHARWRDRLPRVAEDEVFALAIGPEAAPPPPPPVAPLSFERYRPDGEMDWRLRFDGPAIVVNCGTYTRWAGIWQATRRLFEEASDVLGNPERSLTSLTLQYTDVFFWRGEIERYDARLLLNDESEHVPAGIFDHGSVWHLHQGWFRQVAEPVSGRLLERMHIDAFARDGEHLVQFHSLAALTLGSAVGLGSVFRKPVPLIDRLFQCLHDSAKSSLGRYLTDEMTTRINLHASS